MNVINSQDECSFLSVCVCACASVCVSACANVRVCALGIQCYVYIIILMFYVYISVDSVKFKTRR